MDDIVVQMLKNGGISITAWLLRIFNRYIVWCFYQHVSSRHTKGKLMEEIYGKVVISKVMESTKEQVVEEQEGVMSCRGVKMRFFLERK